MITYRPDEEEDEGLFLHLAVCIAVHAALGVLSHLQHSCCPVQLGCGS